MNQPVPKKIQQSVPINQSSAVGATHPLFQAGKGGDPIVLFCLKNIMFLFRIAYTSFNLDLFISSFLVKYWSFSFSCIFLFKYINQQKIASKYSCNVRISSFLFKYFLLKIYNALCRCNCSCADDTHLPLICIEILQSIPLQISEYKQECHSCWNLILLE